MEDKSLKFTKRTILAGSFLLLFSILSASQKSIEKDHFLSINPNIKNEELRGELKIMIEDFDIERQKIKDYYTKEIEKLKEERRLEVKAIKNEFGEKREALLNKYGEDRKLKHSKPHQQSRTDNKKGKDKKPIRKPK